MGYNTDNTIVSLNMADMDLTYLIQNIDIKPKAKSNTDREDSFYSDRGDVTHRVTVQRSNCSNIADTEKDNVSSDSSTLGDFSYHASKALTGDPFFSLGVSEGKEVSIETKTIPISYIKNITSEYLGKSDQNNYIVDDDDVNGYNLYYVSVNEVE